MGQVERKIVFLDAEYTGEHAFTTLVSVGFVTLDDRRLHVSLNDFAEDQVTEWLRENVLAYLPESERVSSERACEQVSSFLETYAEGQPVHLVSAGLGSDLLLLFELFRFHRKDESRPFHALHDLPTYLNHAEHFDLNTMLLIDGVSPNLPREEYANPQFEGVRHHALYDARVVRECFLRLMKNPLLARMRYASV